MLVHLVNDAPSLQLERAPAPSALTDQIQKIFLAVMQCAYAVLTTLQHRAVEPLVLKKELTTSHAEHLETLLEATDLKNFLDHVDQGDFEGFRSAALAHEASEIKVQTPADIKAALYEALSDPSEELLAIIEQVDEAHVETFFREIRKITSSYPALSKVVNDAAFSLKKAEREAKKAEAQKSKQTLYQAGWQEGALKGRTELAALQSARYKDLEAFLLKRRLFGKDPTSPIFKAGLCVSSEKQGKIRDQQLIRTLYQVMHTLRHAAAGNSAFETFDHQVKNLAFYASKSPLFLEMQKYEGRQAPLVAFVQDLCSSFELDGQDAKPFQKMGQQVAGEGPLSLSRLGEKMTRSLHSPFRIPRPTKGDTEKQVLDRKLGTFELDGNKVVLSSGTSSSFLEMHLKGMEEKGGKHLYQGIGEPAGVIHTLQKQFPNTLDVSILSHQEGEKSYGMTEAQKKQAVQHAMTAIGDVDPKGTSLREMTQAMKLHIHAFYAVGNLLGLLKEMSSTDQKKHLTSTLKQVYGDQPDAGFAISVISDIYLRLLTGEPLSQEFLEEVLGRVLARQDVSVSKEVYQVFSTLLKWINEQQGQIQQELQSFANEEFGIAADRLKRITEKETQKDILDQLSTEEEIRYGMKRFPFIKNKGMYGSIIYRNKEGKPFGIFKAIEATFTMQKQALSKLSGSFRIPGQEWFLPMPFDRLKAAMISERATFLFDTVFGTDLVPKTEILHAQGRKGSFQHFVHGYKEAEEVQLPKAEKASSSDIEKFQRFAVMDFLMGNLDRKLDNWMVKMTDDGHIEDIKMIDNANCFTRGHLPDDILDVAKRNQYAWKKLSLAGVPITEETKKLIASLTDEKVEKLIKLWQDDLGDEYFDAFFGKTNGVVVQAFKDRLEILRRFAKEEAPLAKLGSLGGFSAIKEYLGDKLTAPRSELVEPKCSSHTPFPQRAG